MKSEECFSNEEELCSYLDGEVPQGRGLNLDGHVAICGYCSSRLMVWSQLKSLVRASFTPVKAPNHMKNRVRFLLSASMGSENSSFMRNFRSDPPPSWDQPIPRNRYFLL